MNIRLGCAEGGKTKARCGGRCKNEYGVLCVHLIIGVAKPR